MSFELNILPIRYKWTAILISIYIIAIPFQRLLRFETIEYKIQITEIIYLLICLSFVFYTKFGDILKFREKLNKIDIAVLIWLVVGLINLLVNNNISTILEFVGQLYLISFYFILRIVLSSFINIESIMTFYFQSFKIMGLGIFSIIIIGTFLYIRGHDLGVFWKFKDYPYFGTVYRLKALTNEPVMLASILSIPFFIYLVEWIKEKLKVQSQSFINLTLVSILLFFTFSKSLPLLLISVGLLIFYYFKEYLTISIKRLLLLSVCLIFAVQIFMSHFIITKDTNRAGKGYGQEQPILQFNSSNIYETWYIVQKENCLKLFFRSPVLGIGGGNLKNIIIKEKVNFKNSTYDPLSTYTGVFAEYGLLGIFALFILFFSLFSSFNLLQNSLSDYRNLFFLIFIYFCLEAICTDIMNFRHFWVSLAFFSSIISFDTIDRKVSNLSLYTNDQFSTFFQRNM